MAKISPAPFLDIEQLPSLPLDKSLPWPFFLTFERQRESNSWAYRAGRPCTHHRHAIALAALRTPVQPDLV